eukprot:4985999-Amphidinium_carterae.1
MVVSGFDLAVGALFQDFVGRPEEGKPGSLAYGSAGMDEILPPTEDKQKTTMSQSGNNTKHNWNTRLQKQILKIMIT